MAGISPIRSLSGSRGRGSPRNFFPSWRLASAVTALAAAGVNAWRMVGWRGTKSIKHPALLVVHLSYAWIVVGLALRGFINLTGWGLLSMSTHALTVGGLGMMTFGMMCWVGLAHTGRPVKVARSIVVAYIFMVAAAMLRTGAWVLGPSRYAATLDAAGACWCAAFVIYLASYTRILWRPAEGGAAD
ncbi:MAG: NnrS family protein [Deltaproteobacteria bacterium]|nr:NnrS family protein [Deltaproteobacteria bacterium]